MVNHLQQHISRVLTLTEEELENIAAYFTSIEINKKQNLLVEGSICSSNHFVASGCLRMFFINEKGVEQTVQFALENWWLADYTSFSLQKPSQFFIQAVERSQVVSLSFSAQEELLQQFPQMERYFRLIHQRAHAAAQFRIRNLYGVSREALYHQFNKLYPEFVQRIPQYLLASYLGFTPEYLSEIKNKRIS